MRPLGQAQAQVLQAEGRGGFVSAGATLDLWAFATASGELLAARSADLGTRPEAPGILGATRSLAWRKALQPAAEVALLKGTGLSSPVDGERDGVGGMGIAHRKSPTGNRQLRSLGRARVGGQNHKERGGAV